MKELIPTLPKTPIKAITVISFPNKLRVINNESRLVLRKTAGEKLI
jgi:hypothetical protein